MRAKIFLLSPLYCSDEINNPLVAVLSNVQVLLAEVSDAKQRELLTLVESGARRCRDIIQTLMRYVRKTKSTGAEKRAAVVINTVLEEACQLLKGQLGKANVTVHKDYSAVPTFPGDFNELQLVFTNLLLNSRDAIVACGRPGNISLSTSADHEYIVIHVQDDGCGIEKAQLPCIFDPFFTTKAPGSGTGLGLSVVSQIVEWYGGAIDVFSEPDKGTTISVRFPKSSTGT